MIYIVAAGDYFKVGYTDGKMDGRIRSMQVGCPLEMSLLDIFDGSFAAEKTVQEEFRDHHVRGEWFQKPDNNTWEMICWRARQSVNVEGEPDCATGKMTPEILGCLLGKNLTHIDLFCRKSGLPKDRILVEIETISLGNPDVLYCESSALREKINEGVFNDLC